MSEEEARQWPGLMEIVETKVKPDRMKNKREGYRRCWWQFAEKRAELFRAIKDLDRVLVNALYCTHLSFAFLPCRMIFSNKLNVMPLDTTNALGVLHSRPHEIWAWFFSSTLKDDFAYSLTDCFETFPLPAGWENSKAFEEAGETCYTYRAALMVRNNEGMTDTCNRFHDPDQSSEEIKHLRTLHDAMERAVLGAYGWDDIQPECTFLLDYEEEERAVALSLARGHSW